MDWPISSPARFESLQSNSTAHLICAIASRLKRKSFIPAHRRMALIGRCGPATTRYLEKSHSGPFRVAARRRYAGKWRFQHRSSIMRVRMPGRTGGWTAFRFAELGRDRRRPIARSRAGRCLTNLCGLASRRGATELPRPPTERHARYSDKHWSADCKLH
jgi:hypothetical protein